MQFDTSNIKGVITKIETVHHMTGVEVDNSAMEYVFNTNSVIEPKAAKMFYGIAQVGDSIIKESHSDILILKKKDKVFKYKFEKPS